MNKKQIKRVFKALKKVIKIRSLIIILLLLISNTFAWFVYNRSVQSGVTAHVKAWRITLAQGDEEIEDTVNLTIPDIYPGMDDYQTSITVMNESEIPAAFSYVLLKARIMDEVYISDEGANFYHVLSTGQTSDDLINILMENYPFTISFAVDNTEMIALHGETSITASVHWAFDNGDDETDTLYGTIASDYAQAHPGEASIELELLLRIVQTE